MEPTGFAGIVLGDGEGTRARYTSGSTVHEEALIGGRWIGRFWQGAGYVEREDLLAWVAPNAHTPKDIGGLDLAAFSLEIDGQSLHFGWELAGMREAPPGRPGSRHAVVALRSVLQPITVEVHTEADGSGFLVRWLTVTNAGELPAALGAVWCWSGIVARVREWQLLMGRDAPVFTLGYMTERMHAAEGAFGWLPLPGTPVRIESRIGKSGHGTPFFVVRNEATGEHIVGGLAWSGNWAVELTCEQQAGREWFVGSDAVLGFRMGPVSPSPQRVIAPGETVETPRAHLGWLQADFDSAIQAWHRHLRRSVLVPETPGRSGLVICNNVSYYGLEVAEASLKSEIDVAEQVGAEVFVVDAGWSVDIGKDWWPAAGDWECGSKLPNGLEPVFDYARRKGLLCGLWFDLERLGDDSKLLRDHPEWLLQRYGRPSVQGDMDLTNPAAVAHLEDALSRIIERYRLDLFRLDYNAWPYEGGQTPRDGYMENTLWRYYENVYAMYARIRRRFPGLIMENCSGGGGRTDLAMLGLFDHTWVTDWPIAPRFFRVFNGMSMALPPERIDHCAGVAQGAHMLGDLDLQMRAGIFGHFTFSGFYPGRGNEDTDQVERVRHHVDLYKRFVRPFLSESRFYHHTPVLAGREPRGWAVWEAVADDRRRGIAGLFRLAGPAEESYHVRLRGVDAGLRYRVTFDNAGQAAETTGLALMSEGLTVRLARPLTSELLLLEALS